MPLFKLRALRNKYELPGEFFLFLNTLEPRKNLIKLVKAFESFNSATHLVIAGKKGWKTRSILKKIASSPKKKLIHYLGYFDEADKPALFKMAKALLYPSYYEGFGFQALEAMSVGTPVLASQVTSLPEVAGDAALLINPYNEQDLAAAMKALETDEKLRAGLISRGLQRAEGFTWENSARQVLTHLQSLIN
jgi:glycosyltransferase involved in cell wall biosynthesis